MVARRKSLIWSPEAIADLKNIWGYYTDVAGENTAEKIIRELFDGCKVLVQHPLAGRARGEIRSGLRSFVVDAHVFFYRINGNAPEIVRVLDQRQDIDDILIA